MTYAYRDRRNRKRDFRTLWNVRINAAVREFDMSYSVFIYESEKSQYPAQPENAGQPGRHRTGDVQAPLSKKPSQWYDR